MSTGWVDPGELNVAIEADFLVRVAGDVHPLPRPGVRSLRARPIVDRIRMSFTEIVHPRPRR